MNDIIVNDSGLTEAMVATIMLRELDRALDRYPVWEHPFAGLEYSRRTRRSYGQAHADGRIVVSAQFLGTAALADLEDTIRHELAHLIVGIRERHGPVWKRVAKDLGAVPRATGRAGDGDLHARMTDAPFTLVAILRSGEEREIKSVFRRSRRYREYRFGYRGQRYRFQGEDVAYFRYDDNRLSVSEELLD